MKSAVNSQSNPSVNLSTLFYFSKSSLPDRWPKDLKALAIQAIAIYKASPATREEIKKILPDGFFITDLSNQIHFEDVLVRSFKPGVSHPLAQSLANVLKLKENQIKIFQLVFYAGQLLDSYLKELEASWKEPAIEELVCQPFKTWIENHLREPVAKKREDDSFKELDPLILGLDFNDEERAVLRIEGMRRGRSWNRAELELFAQTWSEHCKHKIFAAQIESKDTLSPVTEGLFKKHIRNPSMEIINKDPRKRALSVFHDNAGIIKIFDYEGKETPWAFCIKMETHNSPSAISPYGGASTGVVGVHRDILGTGLGALPIANWNVLCFESPKHSDPRPRGALAPDLIRLGVIKGIEDGGNQSGIPTIQGSVFFDSSYAVKPLVYAGCIGILPQKFSDKRAKVGMKLYCFGGAVGLDGLRGAVMSSRDLRSEDFVGSAVQVANAFTQRRMTDFMIEARDLGLIDVITDNGAGGLASSVGEMALSTGGASIDLTNLRTKYEGLHGWERLLSESQERMTVGTENPDKLEALARDWDIPFDRLGELNNSGILKISYEEKPLIDIDLKTLHDACPQLKLETKWNSSRENQVLNEKVFTISDVDLKNDFPWMVEGIELCSREQIVRRFDHEVQGRTLKKPFAGRTQKSPQDGGALDVYEAWTKDNQDISIVLAHGLAPQRESIVENTVFSYDEALRSAVLSGARFDTLAALDNFCWSDPIPTPSNPDGERRLWRLVRCCEVLSQLALEFEVPFVSGKDSMKNNSREFEAKQTLVISMAGSGMSKYLLPSGYFSRANDVVFCLPPLKPTLKNSVWERCRHKVSKERAPLFSDDPVKCKVEIHELCIELKKRYLWMQGFIEKGKLRGVKDISEGGILHSVFEMCLGESLGFYFEDGQRPDSWFFDEGLGGFVIAVDPHFAREVAASMPQLIRLGVVNKEQKIKIGTKIDFDLGDLENRYLKKGREGLWG